MHHYTQFRGRKNRPTIRTPLYLMYLLAAALLLTFSQQMAAQMLSLDPEYREHAITTFVDHWCGKALPENSGYTLLFLEISPADLVFVKTSGGYVARYRIEVTLLDEQEQQVGSKCLRDSVPVKHYAEIADYDWNRLFRLSFDLPEGEYQATILISDENSRRSTLIEKTIQVESNSAFPVDVSDVLLARRDQYQTKNRELASSVLPYPARVYGYQEPELFCYFEIYRFNREDHRPVEYRISLITPDHRQVELLADTLAYEMDRIPVFRSFGMGDYPPGSYRLKVEVHPSGADYRFEREKPFLVYQNPIDLRFRSFDEVLAELRFVADEEELAALARTPESERQAALLGFWQERDPTPETPYNELMSEFYRRVRYARMRYWEANKRGGDFTDQGKILIMFGEPDRVVRYQKGPGNGILEVWYYPEQGLQVIFQDEFGFGDYRLVAPME
ncbi:MAG: GWxTD domain-containing protein, partial [Calditrichaeota bacterium]